MSDYKIVVFFKLNSRIYRFVHKYKQLFFKIKIYALNENISCRMTKNSYCKIRVTQSYRDLILFTLVRKKPILYENHSPYTTLNGVYFVGLASDFMTSTVNIRDFKFRTRRGILHERSTERSMFLKNNSISFKTGAYIDRPDGRVCSRRLSTKTRRNIH